MARLVARSCSNCGAGIDGEPTGGRVVCRYCGQSFEVAAPPPPPQPAASPARIVVVRRPPPASLPRRIAGGFFVLFFGSMLIAFRLGLLGTRAGQTTVIPLPDFPTANAVGGFMWDTVGGPPVPVTVGAAGAEGFVGRVRARGDDTLWIAAFDGSRLDVVWKTGPLGTYSEGYPSTFVSVVGRSVVVTDYRSTVHVLDLASGHELRSVKLSDRAKSMCASPDGKDRVWIEVSDERNVAFDVDVGAVSAAARPAWCPDVRGIPGNDCRGWLRRGPPRPGCKDASLAPKVGGFEANNVVEEGDVAVALGHKQPGTALPLVVGFDPKTKAVRWQAAVASGDQAGVTESSTISVMDALAAARFVTPYQLTSKGWRFTAFDAKSGQRLWDVPLQRIVGVDHPEGFSLSATRVYVMRTSSLEVYDAKTGALVGIVGGM